MANTRSSGHWPASTAVLPLLDACSQIAITSWRKTPAHYRSLIVVLCKSVAIPWTSISELRSFVAYMLGESSINGSLTLPALPAPRSFRGPRARRHFCTHHTNPTAFRRRSGNHVVFRRCHQTMALLIVKRFCWWNGSRMPWNAQQSAANRGIGEASRTLLERATHAFCVTPRIRIAPPRRISSCRDPHSTGLPDPPHRRSAAAGALPVLGAGCADNGSGLHGRLPTTSR